VKEERRELLSSDAVACERRILLPGEELLGVMYS